MAQQTVNLSFILFLNKSRWLVTNLLYFGHVAISLRQGKDDCNESYHVGMFVLALNLDCENYIQGKCTKNYRCRFVADIMHL